MNYKERVGLNINYYRKIAGLTLKQVADKVGITEATMQKYEKGLIKRVDIEMIESIANAIDTTVDCLTGWLSKDEESAAHQKRIETRNDKWKSVYEKLPYEDQKHVNDYMLYLKNGNDPIPIEVNQSQRNRAMALFALYMSANPETQAQIESLLKSVQSDS